ncbi:lysozyme [Bacillus paralicheniformis]|uniref:lysozyme n=1 Tax=Bacillus paralicheniformis TaxID=1648923 RepID=UPI0021CF1382|nr:lysozyme [Bacillus paralicheniformis]MCU4668630.1 lysozyme [Bacillus paralicheniformis]
MSVCDYKTLPRKVEPQITPFVFHDSVTEPSEGEKLIVGAHRTLTVEITGDCTSREVKFYSVTQDGKKIILEGINSSNHMLVQALLELMKYGSLMLPGKPQFYLK